MEREAGLCWRWLNGAGKAGVEEERRGDETLPKYVPISKYRHAFSLQEAGFGDLSYLLQPGYGAALQAQLAAAPRVEFKAGKLPELAANQTYVVRRPCSCSCYASLLLLLPVLQSFLGWAGRVCWRGWPAAALLCPAAALAGWPRHRLRARERAWDSGSWICCKSWALHCQPALPSLTSRSCCTQMRSTSAWPPGCGSGPTRAGTTATWPPYPSSESSSPEGSSPGRPGPSRARLLHGAL